ncbi:hypothetical protein GCM10029992_67310 [Glycomyces albus]
MVPAVEIAQTYGVRIHLWGVEPPYGTNQAERLVWEADTVETIESEELKPYFAKNGTAAQATVRWSARRWPSRSRPCRARRRSSAAASRSRSP